jgi:hypothetical protein
VLFTRSQTPQNKERPVAQSCLPNPNSQEQRSSRFDKHCMALGALDAAGIPFQPCAMLDGPNSKSQEENKVTKAGARLIAFNEGERQRLRRSKHLHRSSTPIPSPHMASHEPSQAVLYRSSNTSDSRTMVFKPCHHDGRDHEREQARLWRLWRLSPPAPQS